MFRLNTLEINCSVYERKAFIKYTCIFSCLSTVYRHINLLTTVGSCACFNNMSILYLIPADFPFLILDAADTDYNTNHQNTTTNVGTKKPTMLLSGMDDSV